MDELLVLKTPILLIHCSCIIPEDRVNNNHMPFRLMEKGRWTEIFNVDMWLDCTKCSTDTGNKGTNKDKSQPKRTKESKNKDILVELVSDWSSGPFCNNLVSL